MVKIDEMNEAVWAIIILDTRGRWCVGNNKKNKQNDT